MSEPERTNGVNDEHSKVQPVIGNCNLLWSVAQQFSYKRLSDRTGNNEYELIGLYEARAKRIAATYARFYLETEEGGDFSKRGRYYWMALGAFASKTVACLLGTIRINLSYAAGYFTPLDMEQIANGLGKGNLWLFMDISAPHWFYNHYPENFEEGMNCVNQRSATRLEGPVKDIVDDMPWSAESLGKINQMAISGHLKRGFDYVPLIEAAVEQRQRQRLQMNHLLAIADHEQGVVLQPLIYEDPVFSKWTAFQRQWWVRWASPKYELTFTHRCTIRDTELKSKAPDDLIVEDFDSRMGWIEDAASMFHRLMNERENYMVGELNTIATWVNAEDAQWVY
ncbi:MAG: DUF2515 family protein [Cellvibrionaceae bacterium]